MKKKNITIHTLLKQIKMKQRYYKVVQVQLHTKHHYMKLKVDV